MDYVKITRFSDYGFEPQNQSDYLKEKLIQEYEVTNTTFKNGVWVFVKGCEDRYLLNHLENSDIENLKCWEAQIPLHAVAYKHDNPYELSAISTVGNEISEGAFFIPEISLSEIENIKQSFNWFSE